MIGISDLKRNIYKNKFFTVICLLVFVQAFWYAVNFIPSILDEGRHLGAIIAYAESSAPFMSAQDAKWDYLGDISRDSSHLYYYIMSLPLKVINLFTDSLMAQVLVLRLIHTSIFIFALAVYYKIFRKIGITSTLSNVVLLFLVLTPAISILPGAISYDNVVFLFAGLLLLNTVNLISVTKINITNVMNILLLAMFGFLIKVSFLAIIAPVFLYVALVLLRRKTKIRGLIAQFKLLPRFKLVLLASLAVIGVVLLIERPITNYVRYGNVSAPCAEVLSHERCLENYTYLRGVNARANKQPDFQPKSLYEYTVIDWIPNMIRSQVRLNPWDTPNKVLFSFYAATLFGGVALVLIYARELLKNKYAEFILITIIIFTGMLFIKNYGSYLALGQVVATSSRYLLPVQPLFMAMVAVCINIALKNKRNLKVLLVILAIGIFSQGGGILTYGKTADDSLRWPNSATN